MTTYEHGRAPADAPVTWRRLENNDRQGFGQWFLETETAVVAKVSPPCDLDAICRAFHLAALVDEAKDLFIPSWSEGSLHYEAKDWLRRYRAAKGER